MTCSCSSSREQVIRYQPRSGDKTFMRCPWGSTVSIPTGGLGGVIETLLARETMCLIRSRREWRKGRIPPQCQTQRKGVVMPEVIIINADRAEITRLDRAAKAGDPEAIDYMSNWWADYSDVELACFICDAVVEKPIHSAIVGSVSDSSKVDILPLCSKCKNLPRQLQWARITKILRKMHRAVTGKDRHYSFCLPHNRQ